MTWRDELSRSVTDPARLGLARRRSLQPVTRIYPLRITPHLLSLMDPKNPRCPVRRQLVPDPRELQPGGDRDPLGEESFQVEPGVICRFGDRLLALVSARCPAHCRHCNRKRYWSAPGPVAGAEEIARAVSRGQRVREVILSGGEPLLLPDRTLDRLLEAARSRTRVDLLRIHSRIPGTLPSRITAGLVRTLKKHRPLWFVTHFNHEKELCAPARKSLARLREAGIPLLNQAVLLRGVNDSLAAQAKLGRALATSGVKPHYLFQLDRAAGTIHFQVSMRSALDLIVRLRARHSGLVVPHLLADLPGEDGKIPITPSAVLKITGRGTLLRTPRGKRVWYQDQ
jgi:lysine 2,3-aminomutase